MMKRHSLLALLLLILAMGKVQAQSAGNAVKSMGSAKYNQSVQFDGYDSNPLGRTPASTASVTNNNVVTIDVNGLMNLVADDQVAVFNVLQVGSDITETDDMMTSRIQLFKHKLQIHGIDSTAIVVDMISFVPRFNIELENKFFSKTNNEVPAGFELQKNVMVHFKKSSQIDAIVSAAAQAEIYDLVKVDYFVEDLQKSYDTLMTACIAEIKQRMKQYEVLGFKLDSVRKAVSDNFATVFPSQRYFSYQAYSRPSIPATRKGGQPIKLNEIGKNTSQYYNQVEVDGYDLVLHPVITEPVVQLSYSIQVQYFTNEPKPAEPAKNNYYILNAAGEMKQVFPGK